MPTAWFSGVIFSFEVLSSLMSRPPCITVSKCTMWELIFFTSHTATLLLYNYITAHGCAGLELYILILVSTHT